MANRQAKASDPEETTSEARSSTGNRRRVNKAATGRYLAGGRSEGSEEVRGETLPAKSVGARVPALPAAVSGPSEVWQARVAHDLSVELVEDMTVLGLESRTDAVRAALALLHRHAAEVRMAEGVRDYYGGQQPPLPAGVVPFDPREIEGEEE